MSETDDLKVILRRDATELLNGHADGFHLVDEVRGDSGRWTQQVTVIVRGPTGQHYGWDYEEGLTEYQDTDYSDWGNVRKVKPVSVTVTEWADV